MLTSNSLALIETDFGFDKTSAEILEQEAVLYENLCQLDNNNNDIVEDVKTRGMNTKFKKGAEAEFTREIMMELDAGYMASLQRAFGENSVDIVEFIRIMKKHLAKNEESLMLEINLARLFQEIDVNGDGSLEWSEFTEYISETATTTFDDQSFDTLQTICAVDLLPDNNGASHQCERILHCPAPLDKVLTAEGKMLCVYSTTKLEKLKEIAGHTGPLNDILYIPKDNIIVTVGMDGVAIVWDGATLNYKRYILLPAVALVLAHDEPNNLILCGGIDGRVYGIDIKSLALVVAYCLHPSHAVPSVPTRLLRNDSDNPPQVGVQGKVEAMPELSFEEKPEKGWKGTLMSASKYRQMRSTASVAANNSGYEVENFLVENEEKKKKSEKNSKQVRKQFNQMKSDYKKVEVNTRSKIINNERPNIFVTSIQNLPSLGLFATGMSDGSIHLWDPFNGPKKVLKAHTRSVVTLSWSDDIHMLISGGLDHRILVWNTVVDVPAFHLDNNSDSLVGITSLRGGRLVTVDISGSVSIFDMHSLTVVQSCTVLFSHLPVIDMSLDKESFLLYACSTDRLEIIGRDVDVDLKLTGPSSIADFCYLEPHLSFATLANNRLALWDVHTGNQIKFMDVENQMTAVCTDDRDRKLIIADVMGNVNVYNSSTLNFMKFLTPLNCEVVSLAYAKKSRRIITGALDGIVRCYDEEQLEGPIDPLFTTSAHPAEITQVAVSESVICSADADGNIGCWDPETGTILSGIFPTCSVPGHVSAITFLKGSTAFAVADVYGHICIFTSKETTRPFKLVTKLTVRPEKLEKVEFKRAKVEADRKKLRTVSKREERKKRDPTLFIVTGLCYDSSDQELYVCDESGAVTVFDLSSILACSEFSRLKSVQTTGFRRLSVFETDTITNQNSEASSNAPAFLTETQFASSLTEELEPIRRFTVDVNESVGIVKALLLSNPVCLILSLNDKRVVFVDPKCEDEEMNSLGVLEQDTIINPKPVNHKSWSYRADIELHSKAEREFLFTVLKEVRRRDRHKVQTPLTGRHHHISSLTQSSKNLLEKIDLRSYEGENSKATYGNVSLALQSPWRKRKHEKISFKKDEYSNLEKKIFDEEFTEEMQGNDRLFDSRKESQLNLLIENDHIKLNRKLKHSANDLYNILSQM
ncbi:hypothetical protein PCE1_002765 [Barthelona sp. PCE]